MHVTKAHFTKIKLLLRLVLSGLCINRDYVHPSLVKKPLGYNPPQLTQVAAKLARAFMCLSPCQCKQVDTFDPVKVSDSLS